MRILVVAFLGLLWLGPAFADERDDASLTKACRAYLDPEQEFLWRPRKEFQQALAVLKEREGLDALADMDLLRRVVYQGRHFLPRHSARERHRFSWSVPKGYPNARALEKIPRAEPFPLILCIHEEEDTRRADGAVEPLPGGAALKRCYPRAAFGSFRDDWLMLAPDAVRATFLDEEGNIRHRFLTSVLTDFWRRYHVDFDRIVVDGGAPAAALAAAFPHVFAGLVLRPGAAVDLDVMRNWASVPVFVVGDDPLARELEQHGHSDVSTGDDTALGTWLAARRRIQAQGFRWRYKRRDHAYAQWIVLTDPVEGEPVVELTVRTLDTERDPNTIQLDAVGVEELQLFLNDDVVDLDRPVRLVVNGEVRELGKIERDFGRLFEKDPQVRRNMNFGWLYTAERADVLVLEPRSDEPVPDETLPVPDRLAAQRAWLEGRPDEIEEHLGAADGAVSAVHLLPFALRDLWWRPVAGTDLRERCGRTLRDTDGVLADQLRWILAGGGDPYPTFGVAAWDPWPILTALVQDRQMRETTGGRWLPDESPVLRRKVLEAPEEWQHWYARWCAWFYDDTMRTAYEGVDPQRQPAAVRQEERERTALADEIRFRNGWLAVLAGLLFVGGAFVVGRRASQR